MEVTYLASSFGITRAVYFNESDGLQDSDNPILEVSQSDQLRSTRELSDFEFQPSTLYMDKFKSNDLKVQVGEYLKYSNYSQISLYVPKGIGRIELYDGATLSAEIQFETLGGIVEPSEDRVVSLVSSQFESIDRSQIHEDGNSKHVENVVRTWFDVGNGNFVPSLVWNAIKRGRNADIKSGMIIAEDFSKYILGTPTISTSILQLEDYGPSPDGLHLEDSDGIGLFGIIIE